ncbi:MAG TPA: hypothetical protein VFG11_03895, partial [Acidobacteriota bacterium]|nr:hypothetical protein [Acidobacteriota bacterium]
MAVPESKASPGFKALNALAIALACLAYTFFFQIYPNFINPNESSRLLLASALVDDHTSQIDQAMRRYGDTQDKSIYAGHFYAAKVPGYSFLAAPFYFILTRIATVHDTSIMIWLLRFFVNLIPLLFFAIFFRRYLDEKIGIGAKSYFVIAAFLFGTLYYPYAQLLMSHATTGIIWMLGFYFLTEYKEPKYGFVGGAFLGAGFVMEALSFIPIAICGLYLLIRKRRMLILYGVGAGLFSLPSFLYNAYYFGGPLNWPYEHTYDPQFQVETS